MINEHQLVSGRFCGNKAPHAAWECELPVLPMLLLPENDGHLGELTVFHRLHDGIVQNAVSHPDGWVAELHFYVNIRKRFRTFNVSSDVIATVLSSSPSVIESE